MKRVLVVVALLILTCTCAAYGWDDKDEVVHPPPLSQTHKDSRQYENDDEEVVVVPETTIETDDDAHESTSKSQEEPQTPSDEEDDKAEQEEVPKEKEEIKTKQSGDDFGGATSGQVEAEADPEPAETKEEDDEKTPETKDGDQGTRGSSKSEKARKEAEEEAMAEALKSQKIEAVRIANFEALRQANLKADAKAAAVAKAYKSFPGTSSNGNCYSSVDDLFDEVANDVSGTYHQQATREWSKFPANDESMTRVSDKFNDADLNATVKFLKPILLSMARPLRGLDVGAGVGRVAEILVPYIDRLDIVEPQAHFIAHAMNRLPQGFLDALHLVSLQDYNIPSWREYDLVVLNWVVQYLTDKELVELLTKCRRSLTPNGVIFLKDNVAKQDQWNFSHPPEIAVGLVRSTEHLEHIFLLSGLEEMKKSELQQDWAEHSEFDVQLRMFALKRQTSGDDKTLSVKK